MKGGTRGAALGVDQRNALSFASVLHCGQGAQRSIQVRPKVLDSLDTHAQPQQRRRQMLLTRNASPPFDRGLDRAQTGGVLDELQCSAQGVGGTGVATHVERDDRPEALELASRGIVSGVARQAGIARQRDVWMAREALGQCQGVPGAAPPAGSSPAR